MSADLTCTALLVGADDCRQAIHVRCWRLTAVRFAMSPMWLASRQKQARVVARQHFGSDPALCGALLRRPVPLLSAHLSQVTAQESGKGLLLCAVAWGPMLDWLSEVSTLTCHH